MTTLDIEFVYAGTGVTFNAEFLDTTKEPFDPSEVKFAFFVDTGTQTEYTYGVDAEIVKTGTGLYYVTVNTAGMNGQLFGAFAGGPPSTQLAVVGYASILVKPAPGNFTWP